VDHWTVFFTERRLAELAHYEGNGPPLPNKNSAARKVWWVIRLKRIYNFLCSMLVYTPFALCFVTLRGIFMHFPELTY
jgi:hypothetical protein